MVQASIGDLGYVLATFLLFSKSKEGRNMSEEPLINACMTPRVVDYYLQVHYLFVVIHSRCIFR
jgi:hypothetical protein